MKPRPSISSRRNFLRRSLFGSAFGLTATASFAQETSIRITPEQKQTGQHQHDSSPADETDPIKKALQRTVTSLKGFDPARYLTNFDYGRESKLPDGRVLREFELTAQDLSLEVAPGIFFPAWTFNGTVPGPTLRCRQGELVRIHFSNQSITEHTIHLHGIHAANMDGSHELVKPGGTFVYEFIAEPFGLQFYHCHVPPVTLHMNRGLFGVLIIDPKTPRPAAKEMVMVAHGWDTNFDCKNEIYAVNGPANFYRDNPIVLQKGEAVRVYFVNALEFDPINSLHIHGNFFHVYRTGSKLTPDDYTDMITLSQAERCIVEFTYDLAGRYMFHAHQNTFAESGWMGHFNVA
jgi:FtsP/CotA-like multicopper oxidase with cupredoxin domain